MRALVVGAGAVGQVFAYHLRRGGADVAFLVKPKHEADTRRGFTLYPLARRGKADANVRFADFETVTSPAGGTWDQVYITVASDALAGAWLAELCTALPRATIVTLQPGLDDHARVVAAAGDAERVVAGSIGFLAYHAPLPGEEARHGEPGIAYWAFPLMKSPFSGPRAPEVVASLRAGGLPAKRVAEVGREVAAPSAVLAALVAGLEASGWSFATFRADTAAIAARAAREAIAIAAHALGGRAPRAPGLLARAFVLRLVTRLAPRIAPLDVEAYMRAHFTKVGPQMHAHLADYIARGRAAGLPTAALADLAARTTAA